METDRTPNLRTKIMDFIGFDSSIMLIVRGGVLMPTENFTEVLSQGILAGIILAGRFAVSGLIHGMLPIHEWCNDDSPSENTTDK